MRPSANCSELASVWSRQQSDLFPDATLHHSDLVTISASLQLISISNRVVPGLALIATQRTLTNIDSRPSDDDLVLWPTC